MKYRFYIDKNDDNPIYTPWEKGGMKEVTERIASWATASIMIFEDAEADDGDDITTWAIPFHNVANVGIIFDDESKSDS